MLACFAGWLVIASGPRVTRERFEQIKKGMTREQVIHTVGGPPGNYSRRHTDLPALDLHETWLCDDSYMIVRFADAHAHPGIRRWLGLRMH